MHSNGQVSGSSISAFGFVSFLSMDKGFTILDHPADLGIEAHGSTLKDAFEQSAIALMSVILDLTTVECIEKRQIEIAAADLEHLLVKWLAEILYLYDGRQFVAKQFTIDQLTSTALTAVVIGEQVSLEKHRTKLDVKAVTYHQLSVTENNEGAVVRVFLDI